MKNVKLNGQVEIGDRFFLDSLRSTGYDPYTAIFELIDNSIDAGSSKIQIKHDKENSTLVISDDGDGMSFNNLNAAMNLGYERKYKESDIGNFGVGLKTALVNLISIDDTPIVLIETCNGVEKTTLEWDIVNNGRSFSINKSKAKSNDKKGTMILIKDVIRFTSKGLHKNIGTTYYPILSLKDRNELSILINEEVIEPIDPLYRDSELTQHNFVNSTVCGEEIKINAVLIDNLQEKTLWDTSPRSSDNGWAYSKAGIYIIYGSRYIELGGTHDVFKDDPWLTRTRIEFGIPKKLTNEFSVKFNKTGLSLDTKKNENLKDLVVKLKQMYNWGSNIRRKKKSTVLSDDEKKELSDIQNRLNKSANKIGLDRFNKKTESGVLDVVDFNNEENSDRNGRGKDIKPRKKKNNIIFNELFFLKVESFDNTDALWFIQTENNKLVITLNDEHVFYKEIYSEASGDLKNYIMAFMASIAYVQHNQPLEFINADEDTFWKDYWSEISKRLRQIIKIYNNR